MAVRVHDINERVAGNERRASVYICCHRAGKAKDLYSRRVFVRRERHWRRDDRGKARERQWRERERKREKERSCVGRVSRAMSREWQKERKGVENGGAKKEGRKKENAEEDGRREVERGFSRRAGRINKRGAPPSHLGHLYFAAAHGRKSSSVSEIRGVRRRECKKEGRGSAARVKDHGHLPRAHAQPLIINPSRTIHLR